MKPGAPSGAGAGGRRPAAVLPWRRWLALLAANGVAGTLVLLLALAAWLVPGFEAVRAASTPSDRWLLDRHGAPLQVQRVDDRVRRLEWTPLERISPALLRAIVATEDRRFHRHAGVDWIAIGALLRGRLAGEAGARRGASTITMQLAGLLDPGLRPQLGRRSAAQKVRQTLAALGLGWHWRREQVLEAYLNRVSFRGELQGVAAAAQGLFGKAPAALDEAESWLLAALLARPNAAPAAVGQRACRLAQRHAAAAAPDSGARGEAGAAASPAAAFEAAGPDPAAGDSASLSCARLVALASAHFGVAAAIRPPPALAPHVARRLFAAEAGPAAAAPAPAAAADAGAGRAPRVTAPIQSTLDRDLQRVATDALRSQVEALSGRNMRDGALLVVDNASGEVLAYVGNTGPGSSARHVDGVQAPRQAGSTLKPFLYQLAIEQRLLTAASLVDDSPVDLVAPNGLYVPRNYDRRFTGWVSLRTALAGSLNVPAVRTLMLVGADPFADRLRALGFADVTESGDFYGYSLALGSAEVRLAELVNAFRTLANGGIASPLRLAAGAPGARGRRVMDEAAAFVVADMLADRAAGTRTFGLASALVTRGWSAVKTGTSKDMRDNWCIGFSARYTVGVWVGNFDGAPMHDVSGVSGAAPVWQEVMEYLHRDDPAQPPRPPAGLVQADVRVPATAPAQPEWFLAGTEQRSVVRVAPGAERARIVYPGAGVVIAIDPDIPAGRQRLLLAAAPPSAALAWQLDGASLGKADRPLPWRPVPGRHRLQLVDAGGRMIDEVAFEVRGGRLTERAGSAGSAGDGMLFSGR